MKRRSRGLPGEAGADSLEYAAEDNVLSVVSFGGADATSLVASAAVFFNREDGVSLMHDPGKDDQTDYFTKLPALATKSGAKCDTRGITVNIS